MSLKECFRHDKVVMTLVVMNLILERANKNIQGRCQTFYAFETP